MTPKKFSALIGAFIEYKTPPDEEQSEQTKKVSKKKAEQVPMTYIDEAPSWWN